MISLMQRPLLDKHTTLTVFTTDRHPSPQQDSTGFKPAILASRWSQAHALDCAATEI